MRFATGSTLSQNGYGDNKELHGLYLFPLSMPFFAQDAKQDHRCFAKKCFGNFHFRGRIFTALVAEMQLEQPTGSHAQHNTRLFNK